MASQPLDLDLIEARANAATPGPWHLTDADTIVAPLTTEAIADVWEPTHASRNGEFIENARTDVPALLAEVRRLRAELAAAHRRVTELERPAEAERRRQVAESFRELAAQARADGDFEGEASVLGRLEDRQQQWARIDAADEPPAVGTDR